MDRLQNVPDRPVLEANPQRLRFEGQLIKSETVLLDASQRQLVLRAIRQHCSHRGWVLHAAHVRSNHVHLVTWANTTPEEVMSQLKRYASRALNLLGSRPPRRWARHGTTRHLWTVEQVVAAVDYVEYEQGHPVALYVNSERE